MTPMLVVYSAIYGDYDRPKPVPNDGNKYVMYTDTKGLHAPGWEVRYEPMDLIDTPMMRAKYWKTHPHRVAPTALATVWIDGSLTPLKGFADRCAKALHGVDIAFTPHPLRDCIYDEYTASAGLPKYNADMMSRQVEHYRTEGHPEHWGLFATGCIARMNLTRVMWMNVEWWQHNVEWSWQDQLSLPFVLRNHPEVMWDARLPWSTPLWGYTDHGVGV